METEEDDATRSARQFKRGGVATPAAAVRSSTAAQLDDMVDDAQLQKICGKGDGAEKPTVALLHAAARDKVRQLVNKRKHEVPEACHCGSLLDSRAIS